MKIKLLLYTWRYANFWRKIIDYWIFPRTRKKENVSLKRVNFPLWKESVSDKKNVVFHLHQMEMGFCILQSGIKGYKTDDKRGMVTSVSFSKRSYVQ